MIVRSMVFHKNTSISKCVSILILSNAFNLQPSIFIQLRGIPCYRNMVLVIFITRMSNKSPPTTNNQDFYEKLRYNRYSYLLLLKSDKIPREESWMSKGVPSTVVPAWITLFPDLKKYFCQALIFDLYENYRINPFKVLLSCEVRG